MHAKRASGQFTLYAEFWETDKDGVDIRQIGTSEQVVVANTETEYRVSLCNRHVYEMQSKPAGLPVGCTPSPVQVHLHISTSAGLPILTGFAFEPSDASDFVSYVAKTTLADPASGTPGQICINTAIGPSKLYVGAGGWVTIGSAGRGLSARQTLHNSA